MRLGRGFVRFGVVFACLCALGLASEPAQAAKMQDDPKGFNGYSWGDALANYPFMRLLTDLGSTDFVSKAGVYENPGEALTFGGVTFAQIQYRFLDEQLESIQLKYEGADNRDKLMRWLEDQFGKIPIHERRKASSMQWFGDTTTVSLSFEPSTKKGSLWFMSQALNHRFNEFHQATQGD